MAQGPGPSHEAESKCPKQPADFLLFALFLFALNSERYSQCDKAAEEEQWSRESLSFHCCLGALLLLQNLEVQIQVVFLFFPLSIIYALDSCLSKDSLCWLLESDFLVVSMSFELHVTSSFQQQFYDLLNPEAQMFVAGRHALVCSLGPPAAHSGPCPVTSVTACLARRFRSDHSDHSDCSDKQGPSQRQTSCGSSDCS